MAKVLVDMTKQQLSGPQSKVMKSVVAGKVIDLEMMNSELDLDGQFVAPASWNGMLLWDRLKEAETKIKQFAKPTKVTSNLEEPGTYSLEIETADEIHKGKVNIALKSGDTSSRVIKPNSIPKHVKVANRAPNLKDGAKAAPDDMKHLLSEMGKTANYTYSGKTLNGWVPKIPGHSSHEESSIGGWKAYIDEPSMGLGTKWRLMFTTDFNQDTQTLVVTLMSAELGH
jgi:hypothetical protein